MEKDYRELTSNFMEKLKIGDRFSLNKRKYSVERLGTWKSEHFVNHQYKTVSIRCEETNEPIKFFYFFGYEGNPKSKSRTASVKQHQFVRDVEGTILVDLINRNNPLHEASEIYKMAIK